MKKVLPILLSFILLASHMSLSVGTHFCCGEAMVTKILVGDTHLGSGMQDMEGTFNDSNRPNTNELHFENVPCCENRYQTLQSTDEFIKDVETHSCRPDFVLAFVYTTPDLEINPNSTHRFFTEYISPPLEKDIQILFQTFLI
ncbi:MAG: hypothetical protein RQ761_09475 [Bacteroidales bacterium]|nr:hypothetical protein [Bacteroidales bacterium]